MRKSGIWGGIGDNASRVSCCTVPFMRWAGRLGGAFGLGGIV